METPAARTTSWTAAWLLAEAWIMHASVAAVGTVSAYSMNRPFGLPIWIPPSWLVPALEWGAGIGLVLAILVLLRTPLAPATALLRWQTTYFLWLAIPSLFFAMAMAAAADSRVGPGVTTGEIAGIFELGTRVFLPLGLLLFGTWWLRRRASRFAGTATAASHLALAAFVPAGPLAILHWWRIVRPVEERPAA